MFDLLKRLIARLKRLVARLKRFLSHRGDTVQDVIAAPARYMKQHGSVAVDWTGLHPSPGIISIDDIKLEMNGQPIAWVIGLTIDSIRQIAIINHIAVTNDLVRNGLGRALVRAIGTELHNRFQVTQIRFNENHPDYNVRTYNIFFEAIGAHRYDGNERHWEWTIP